MKHFKGLQGIIAKSLLVIALAGTALGAAAQTPSRALTEEEFNEKYGDLPIVYQDSAMYTAPTTHEVRKENLSPYQVVTNKFGKNWFAFATGGYHSFQGDYSNWGKFDGTLSYDWGVGIGKWFTPGVGLKVEFIRGDSRGYTAYKSHYGYGDKMMYGDEPYWKMRTMWWDISGSVILNLSRLFLGYEGYMSPRLMNQFMVCLGIGGVHHLGYGKSYGSDNEWGAHAELQYSRFFTPAKRWSLDFKLRGIFYQTNFDSSYGQFDHANKKWDANLGVDVGFTFYLDSKRNRGWKQAVTHTYTRDYAERQYREVRASDKPFGSEFSEITFYVFYPNNYSGRNDYPTVQSSQVNAIDYLTGGIYTQRRYTENAEAATGLLNHANLSRLHTTDIPTEPSDQDFGEMDYIPRGYEMGEGPISLPTDMEAMAEFRKKAGYYYAPIYGDKHLWHYRIDDATLDQKLLSEQNYYEDTTYGLNSHHGLDIIRDKFSYQNTEYLVSLADMYAALNSNEGHIAEHTDQNTVDGIRSILENGIVTNIFIEGLATSQDNYTGPNAREVGWMRNTALSDHRAKTVLNWLKEYDVFKNNNGLIHHTRTFKDAVGGIGRVDDPSTRGLDAKLNRCVKVHIQFMIPPRR